MKLRSLFLKAFVTVVLVPVIFIAGCTSSTEPDTTAAVPTGTLYYTTGGRIYSMNLESGVITNLVTGLGVDYTNEGTLITNNGAGLVEYNKALTSSKVIVETNNTAADYLTTYNDGEYLEISVSPDGKYVAYITRNNFHVVDRWTGALKYEFVSGSVLVRYFRPSWTPDGRLVVAGYMNNPGLYISDATLTSFQRFDPNLISPSEPMVSPDGKTVAFIMNDHVHTIGIDGTGLKQVTTSMTNERKPTWSPDGKWLAITFTSDISVYLLPMKEEGYRNVRNINDKFGVSVQNFGEFVWK